MISLIVLTIVSETSNNIATHTDWKYMDLNYIASFVFSFDAQVILITIMWQLASSKVDRFSETEYPPVLLTDFDVHAEFQARI